MNPDAPCHWTVHGPTTYPGPTNKKHGSARHETRTTGAHRCTLTTSPRGKGSQEQIQHYSHEPWSSPNTVAKPDHPDHPVHPQGGGGGGGAKNQQCTRLALHAGPQRTVTRLLACPAGLWSLIRDREKGRKPGPVGPPWGKHRQRPSVTGLGSHVASAPTNTVHHPLRPGAPPEPDRATQPRGGGGAKPQRACRCPGCPPCRTSHRVNPGHPSQPRLPVA